MPKENNQRGHQKRPHRDGKTDLIQSSILSLKVDVGLEYFHVFTQHAIGMQYDTHAFLQYDSWFV